MVVVRAVMKIGSILKVEAAGASIYKLSDEVTNRKEFPLKVEQISEPLLMSGGVIGKIGTVYGTDEVAKSCIGQARKLAYHVEDVIDKLSYHILQHQKEGFLKKVFLKEPDYVKLFS